MLFEGHGQSKKQMLLSTRERISLPPVSHPIPTVIWSESLECMSKEQQALLQQWRIDLHNTPLKALCGTLWHALLTLENAYSGNP